MHSYVHSYVIATVVIASVGRLAWFAQFGVLSVRKRPSGTGRIKQLRSDALLPAQMRGSTESQEARYELYKTQQTAAFTLGTLALAAWTILAAASTLTPQRRLALAMLSATVLLSIGTTLLFRMAGGELTRMGFESGLAISGLALVAAMLVTASDVFSSPVMTALMWIVPAIAR